MIPQINLESKSLIKLQLATAQLLEVTHAKHGILIKFVGQITFKDTCQIASHQSMLLGSGHKNMDVVNKFRQHSGTRSIYTGEKDCRKLPSESGGATLSDRQQYE